MRYLIFLGTAVFLAATTSAFAVGLTTADYEYLETQNIERTGTLLQSLSPKEQARLHAIINFVPNTPASQAKDVAEALELYMQHQNWERTHPGELWDLPRRDLKN
jgi:hypothetical protein